MAVQVAPENVVGRDKLIANIWRKLRNKSLRFTAERRVGKTTVMTKMTAEPPDGVEVLFLELEGIDSVERFTEVLLARMKPLLSRKDTAKQWLGGFVEKVGGTEIGGVVKLPKTSRMGWQATLEQAVKGLCQHQGETTVVLLLDELPYMLQKIAHASEEAKTLALTLLDTLRALRQQHRNLRMVYAGSVGLHHVITDLKQDKLASEPVNDMPLVEIRALEQTDAITLADRLLNDEQVGCSVSDRPEVLEQITAVADCVPWYLERVVSGLADLCRDITPEDVQTVATEQLTTSHDPWEMKHFRERLSVYYQGAVRDTAGQDIPNAEIARRILDENCQCGEPQSIDQVWSVIKARFALVDRQHIVEMLELLSEDHYLIADTQKRYTFRFPLIQGWWKTNQGLGS